MSTRRRYNIREGVLVVVFTARDGRYWAEGGGEGEAFRAGVRTTCLQRARKARATQVKVHSEEGGLLAHYHVTAKGLEGGEPKSPAGSRRVRREASGHVVEAEQQDLLSSSGNPPVPTEEEVEQWKGMGEAARFHTGPVLLTAAGWQKVLQALSHVTHLLEVKGEAVKAAGLERILVHAQENLTEALEKDARPLARGTSLDKGASEGNESEDAAEAQRIWEARGVFSAALRELGFAITDMVKDGEVWSDGNSVVRVREKHAEWSSGPKEKFTVLSFRDALARATALLKEAAGEEPPAAGTKSRRKAATSQRRGSRCTATHPAERGLQCERAQHKDSVHHAGKGAKRKEWISSGEDESAGEEKPERPQGEAPKATRAEPTPGPWRVEHVRPGVLGVMTEADGSVVAEVCAEEDEAGAFADATLLAAAPEMRDVLKDAAALLARMNTYDIHKVPLRDELEQLQRRVRETLDQAEGRAHG